MIRARNSKTLPEFSAVILDLDGLAIDSESTYRNAWQQAGQHLGYSLEKDLVDAFEGLSYDRIEKMLAAEFGQTFPFAQFRQTSAAIWHESVERTGIQPMPGLHSLLALFAHHAIPYCLATNSDQIHAEKCLRYARLDDAFPMRITRDQVAAPKPAPDIYLAAAARLSANPAHCIVLEDSETGARAGLEANMTVTIIANHGRTPQSLRSQVFAVFEDLHGFRHMLERSFRDDTGRNS